MRVVVVEFGRQTFVYRFRQSLVNRAVLEVYRDSRGVEGFPISVLLQAMREMLTCRSEV